MIILIEESIRTPFLDKFSIVNGWNVKNCQIWQYKLFIKQKLTEFQMWVKRFCFCRIHDMKTSRIKRVKKFRFARKEENICSNSHSLALTELNKYYIDNFVYFPNVLKVILKSSFSENYLKSILNLLLYLSLTYILSLFYAHYCRHVPNQLVLLERLTSKDLNQ